MSSIVAARATNWQAVPDTSAQCSTFSIATSFMTGSFRGRSGRSMIVRAPRYGAGPRPSGTKSVLRRDERPRYRSTMKSYGQFCSIARSLDLLGERWTLLVVRELLCGSRRFGDIQRGIPRVSRTMLSARLRELLDAGVIERHDGARGPEYRLTTAGQELAAVVRELGTWGQRWLTRELHRDELDARVLLWDIQRRVRRDALPERPLVVALELTDVRGATGRHYLLLRRSEVSLCATNLGFPEELRV